MHILSWGPGSAQVKHQRPLGSHGADSRESSDQAVIVTNYWHMPLAGNPVSIPVTAWIRQRSPTSVSWPYEVACVRKSPGDRACLSPLAGPSVGDSVRHYVGVAKTTMVVLDGNEGEAASIPTLLIDEGYDVIEARAANEAIGRFGNPGKPFDLIVVDTAGPGGLDTIRQIRETDPVVPIVVVSSRIETSDIIAALEAGADDFVSKPFTASILLIRVRALLRRPG